MTQINPGDIVRITGAFTDAAGAAADPTTVTLRIRAAGGTADVYVYGTDVELVKDSVGNYYLDYEVPNSARRLVVDYRWEATGTVTAAEEGQFFADTAWLAP